MQMSGHGEKLSRKQEQAITALLTQPTLSKAAKEIGIGAATLRRWLKRPHFVAQYRAARRQAVETAVGALQRAAIDAVDCLRKNLKSATPSVQVRAAIAILDQAFRGVELVDLAERIETLEQASKGAHVARHI
jgi:hypothetical protein